MFWDPVEWTDNRLTTACKEGSEGMLVILGKC